MTFHSIPLSELLDRLESHYGKLRADWPVDPYEFLVWWHCGYPQSDARCSKGWAALTAATGIDPASLLAAKPATLAAALQHGGMVPELRALRLKEIAQRVQDQLGDQLGGQFGDQSGGGLRAALAGSIKEARKILKSFPNIGDPGADRILLFARLAPAAAVPSNNVAVVIRMLRGRERENYGVNYRESQQEIEAATAPNYEARSRAYLLLKRHGQELCKRVNPKCEECPVRGHCAYYSGNLRGRSRAARVPGSRR